MHLDMNLSRAFVLKPKDSEHLGTVTLNARSANALNHANINGIGTIVSSPQPGQTVSGRASPTYRGRRQDLILIDIQKKEGRPYNESSCFQRRHTDGFLHDRTERADAGFGSTA